MLVLIVTKNWKKWQSVYKSKVWNILIKCETLL